MKHYQVWNSIEYKANNEINSLTQEEKDLIIERAVNSLQVELHHTSDEGLLVYCKEKGLVL